MSAKHQARHDRLVRFLLHKPYLLGLSGNISSSTDEYQMFMGDRLYVVPDLYFNEDKTHRFFEVKTSTSRQCMRKADQQIERMYEWCDHNNLRNFTIGLVYPAHKKACKLEQIIVQNR